MRDGYAFRQHVEAARRNRGVEMIPEFDEFPVFYFTNHQSVIGPGPVEVMPEHLKKLDFELEACIVIGKEGRNMDHLCLRIEPFDSGAIAAHLLAHGVVPGETKMRYGAEGEGLSLYITDPDGNIVELKGPPAREARQRR